MTTWHESDTLNEALDFFVDWSLPTEGFRPGSDHWLAMSIANPEWQAGIHKHLTKNR